MAWSGEQEAHKIHASAHRRGRRVRLPCRVSWSLFPMHISDFVDEYRRWRKAAESAIAQVPDDQLNRILAKDGNSVAMLMRHVGGNLSSRFTEFLTSDGEKPWRDRDS